MDWITVTLMVLWGVLIVLVLGWLAFEYINSRRNK